MNRSTPGLKLSKAIPGFLQYKSAEALSPSTLESYRKHLEQWFAYLGDKDVKKITPQEIRAYLVWLQTEYKPHRFGGNEQRLSPKTVHNVWISLSAFFSWANREFNFPSPMKMVPRPKFEVVLIEPFTKEEIEVLLTACDYSHEAKTDRHRKFVMRRFTAYRDRAVILFLLDTGLRSSELCALKIGDVDQKTGKVTIKHGATGGAKGKKGRVVYMGKSTRRALGRYLATREDADDSETSLFLGKFYRPLNSP